MKAATYYKYGSSDVLHIEDVAQPVLGEGEVLIQVKAASINAYDWHLLRAKPFFTRFLSGLLKPRDTILGADIAGIVVSADDAVTRWKRGDEVYGCLESCGAGGLATGGFAEYARAKETVLAPKPATLSFEEAAALPMAAVTALQGLRDDGKLQPGQAVLINGASGGVGTFAMQIAKALGAQVTAVCSSGAVEVVRSLGADRVIDYAMEDFSKGGQRYDLIVDIAANRTVAQYRRALKPQGRCVVIGFSDIVHLLNIGLLGGKRISILMADNTRADGLVYISELCESGKLKPVIDRRYTLDEASAAIRYVEEGHPKGKVVLEIGNAST